MAKRNVTVVQDSVNGLETTNGINIAQVTGTPVDNQLVRFNGTTGEIQGSGVVVNDNGYIGVNNSSPAYAFHSKEPNSTYIAIERTVSGSEGYILVGATSSKNQIISSGLSGVDKPLTFETGSTERMRIDSSGNVGIGVTPSAWNMGGKTLEINSVGNAINSQNNQFMTMTNAYYASGWKYGGSYPSTNYVQYNGTHYWQTAPSGTAGNPITWTTAMTLNASGNLGLGVAPSAWASYYKVIDIGDSAGQMALYGRTDGSNSGFTQNAYRNASSVWTYKANGYAFFNEISMGGSYWYTAPSGTAGNPITWTTAMTLDASGNMGLGVTPSAWQTEWKALELSGKTVITDSTASTYVGRNWYRNTSYQIVYKTSDFATMYEQNTGQHKWFTAPSGTAGNPITWTSAMTLDNSGNLGLGVTPSAAGSQFRELDIGSTGALFSYAPSASSSVLMGILCNAYSDGTNYKYKQTREATGYQQYNGSHQFFTAPSGTAGNNVTFTTALTIPNTGGIQLPNTAITNATTLDWYEEGTFTPTIVGTATAGTGTYSTQYGKYTRIGDRVHINFRIVWTAHTGTGNISIGGLPFASNAEVGNFAANVLYPLSDLTYSGGALGISISQGQSVLSVYTMPVSTGSAGSVAMDTASTLFGSITYRV